MSEDLRQALFEARNKLQEQDAFIRQVTETPNLYGSISLMLPDSERCVVQVGGGTTYEMNLPVNSAIRKQMVPGKLVHLHPDTKQIIGVSNAPMYGDIVIIKDVINKELVEVETGNGTRVVASGSFKVKKGDRVVLDPTSIGIIHNLGRKDTSFSFEGTTNVTWDSIGGLKDAKIELIEAIEMPHTHKTLFSRYGKKPPKGVLLYGPPGCGKTMLAKAAAASIAKIYGASGKGGFIYVKGPEILSKWVGESEGTVRSLFSHARDFSKKNGHPAIMFIDEAEALLSARGSRTSSDMEKTIVPAFLAEMDGLDPTGCIVILATNRSDMLDPAIIRDGRIDRKIKVSRPGQNESKDIFSLNFKGKPLVGATIAEVSKHGAEVLFDEKWTLYDVQKNDGTSVPFTLGHLASGALVAGVVDQAVSIAMRREMETKKTDGGICCEDVSMAVSRVFTQTKDLNHTEDLTAFSSDFKHQVKNVVRRSQVTA